MDNKIVPIINEIRNKMNDKRFLSIALIVVFALTCVSYFIYDYAVNARSMLLPSADSIKFSAESGFYGESIEVGISLSADVPWPSRICYSLDGGDPKEKYREPIKLDYVEGETNIYVLKAAVYHFGIFSGSVSKTYMIGDETPDIDFISITADYDDLYDYKKGILVAGKTYDKNIAAGAEGYVYGNYSMRGEDWIRDACFTMIDTDGKLVTDREVGIEVAGGTSSTYSVKSLRIIGQNEFMDKGKLNLDINLSPVSNFSLNNSFNSIRLRSGSQDINMGNVRSAVVSRLCQQAGFSGSVGTRRALVYLNGSLYGIFDIQQNYTESFLKQRYSLPDTNNIVRIESSESGAFSRSWLDILLEKDLGVKENRDELEKRIDLDNYFTYYAIECLIDNTDWPANNVKMWKYTGGFDGANPYTDGRYRFLIFDTDLTYYTEGNTEYFKGCFQDNLVSIMEGQFRGAGSKFPLLMKVPEYKARFLAILSDLLNGPFSKENVLTVIDEEITRVDGVYERYFSDEVNSKRKTGLDLLVISASQRDEQIREDVEKYFRSTQAYRLHFFPSQEVTLRWVNKTVYPGEEYSCDYFDKAEFDIAVDPSPGYEFLYFLVNGEAVYEDTVHISKDTASDDGLIELEAVCRPKEGGILVIEQVSAKGDNWILLRNIGDKEVNLYDYYLSDNGADYRKSRLPKLVLAAGESFKIYGKDSSTALNEYICSFKIAGGERLYLFDSKGNELCDSVFIPAMGRNETYCRYIESSNFFFYRNVQ